MKALLISLCLCLTANIYPGTASERLEKYYNNFISNLPGSALLSDKLDLEGLVLNTYRAFLPLKSLFTKRARLGPLAFCLSPLVF